MLAKDETLYMKLEGAACVEVRHAPGQFKSRSQGMSFRIAKGINYRVGGSSGHYVPGPESPTAIDAGVVLVTSDRILFRGVRESREWKYTSLTGFDDSNEGSWTALPVTNRQKTSGIGYPADLADDVRLRMRLALADYHGSRKHIAAEIEGQLAQLDKGDDQ